MKPTAGALSRYAIVPLLLAFAVATWISPLDQPARESVDAGLKRALITFASARGLNGVISVVQGTEFNVGVGAGATFAVGEILDPVNDLVEQFSDLMLLATVSFGIQEVLLAVGSHAVLKLALTVLLAGWAILRVYGRDPPGWLSSLLILGLMVRFAIPVASAGADVVFTQFLADRYETGEQAIEIATTSVRELSPEPAPVPPQEESGDRGWLEQSWEKLKGATEDLDPRARLSDMKASVEAAVENVVWLMVVFVLQTLIVPLAVLGVLYGLARNVFSSTVAGRSSPRAGG